MFFNGFIRNSSSIDLNHWLSKTGVISSSLNGRVCQDVRILNLKWFFIPTGFRVMVVGPPSVVWWTLAVRSHTLFTASMRQACHKK